MTKLSAPSRPTRALPLLALGIAIAAGLGACSEAEKEAAAETESAGAAKRTCAPVGDEPIKLAGGTFVMGEEDVYQEEGPARKTTVDGFWIDRHEVTNRQFREFVDATGYVTVAEKPVDPAEFGVPREQIPADLLLPGSAVFTPPDRPSRNYADWWKYVPGTSWKKPYGPDGADAVPEAPVVHLAWDDMVAYAKWRGGRIPTEAEWEYAASAGKRSENVQPEEANTWQGMFPMENRESDGFRGVSPVGCFQPNTNGLYDMVGNVWEVTADFFRPGHDPEDTKNPAGPDKSLAYDPMNPTLPSRTVKGGSYLCAPNYCQRYRPASRQGRDPGMGTSNVGFRLVYDKEPRLKS